MTKYKRWILLLTALTVFVVHVESLRATSLIHAGKFSKLLNTTTSTTTTEESPPADKLREILDEVPDDELTIEVNGTKIALTGIPQIDYVWDPNLPRELNGFNLSSYPFLDSMPAEEDIGFDCEDKINGFYASIKFGCQLYHHCLYGVRSDFICANFTAFDQKTFICHFASEVDCKNSYKYWSRNDDLYKATTEKSTTPGSGLVPLIDRNLYKRPAPGSSPLGGASRDSSATQSKDSPNLGAANNNQPPLRSAINNNDDFPAPVGARPPSNRPLRRPYRRRRPQIDYYYYDDDYEDDFYDDRGRRRQQRPRNRRPIYDDYDNRRPYDDRDNRKPNNDDFDDYEYDRRPYRNRNRSESRRNGDDRRRQEDRRFDDRRRPYNKDDRKPIDDRRRPDDERRFYDDRRTSDDRRQTDDRKRYDEEKGQSEDRKYGRRKNHDDTLEEKRKERAPEPRQEALAKKQFVEETPGDERIVKPIGSIFDRPRPSPKISRPVPLSEKNKYLYKSPEKSTLAEDDNRKDEEYYEEEYDDLPSSSAATNNFRINRYKNPYDKPVIDQSLTKNVAQFGDELSTSQYSATRKPLPALSIEKKFANKQTIFDPTTTETTLSTATQSNSYLQRFFGRTTNEQIEPENIEDQRAVVRVVKRPFLPSRGGNPFKGRGLQPVGQISQQQTSDQVKNNHYNQKQPFLINSNDREGAQKTTLDDIYNEEYDVEINDALNPMLKPLTSSRGISGFSFSSLPNDERDGYKSQSRHSIQRAEAPETSSTTTTTEVPIYDEYDDDVEYEYK
ncbi:CLUMA_CG009487, isoform A [Clunio marinus]|uniref:CLUMA_CG009487, isoform A n=1 Tax=Clunio marinus TaxID=568069 RepID=A0A1J1I8K7_9DIPT|nr:CLUMA_CG009487, isoform A [Clunio marinus]